MGCFHSKEAVAQETLETAFEQPLSFPHNSDAGVKYAVDGKVQSLQVLHHSPSSSRLATNSITSKGIRGPFKSFVGADLNAIVDEQGTINALVSRQLSMMSHYSVKSESGAVILEPEEQSSKEGLKLNKLIGRGGFGNVYLGDWEGQKVAVKVVSAHLNEQADEQIDHEWEAKKEKMAQMEAILMSAMNHPNIVHTFKVTAYQGEARDPETAALEKHLFLDGNETPSFEWHIIMEYCDRGSLSRALATQRFHEPCEPGYVKWDAWACLEIIKEIVMAIMFLHENRILHGDLKAANVLLSSAEQDRRGFVAKVSDFGLSRVLGGNKNHIKTQTFGTVTHMPPELLSKGVLSQTADVYAVGVLMWEVYSADRVFKALSDSEVILAVVTRKLRPTFPADCPSRYRYLSERCWAEMPEARPSLQQLLNELEVLQDSLCPQGSVSPKMIITSTMKAQKPQKPPPQHVAAPAPQQQQQQQQAQAQKPSQQMSRLSQSKGSADSKALAGASPLWGNLAQPKHVPMPAITYSTPGMSSQSFTYQKGAHPVLNIRAHGGQELDMSCRANSFLLPVRSGMGLTGGQSISNLGSTNLRQQPQSSSGIPPVSKRTSLTPSPPQQQQQQQLPASPRMAQCTTSHIIAPVQ